MWNIIFSLFFNPSIENETEQKHLKNKRELYEDEGSSVDLNIWNIFLQEFERRLFSQVKSPLQIHTIFSFDIYRCINTGR